VPELIPPPDKSISHRALFLSALASGDCTIYNLNQGFDVAATLACLTELGLSASWDERGLKLRPGPLSSPNKTLNCANSGTTIRLLLGLLAGADIKGFLDGDDSLRARPMGGISEPLCSAGASLRLTRGAYPPIEVVSGIKRDIAWTAKIPSAQVKSGLLLAGLVAGRSVRFSEPLRTRDHTERLLAWLGQRISVGKDTVFHPGNPLPGFRIAIPGDPSSGAFLVAFRLIRPGPPLVLKGICLNPTRMGFYNILLRMGARIAWDITEEDPEPVGNLFVEHSGRLSGVEVGPEEIPSAIDELPLLGIIASVVEGEVLVRGAGSLRTKESDRIRLLVKNLLRQGAEAEEFPDGFRVKGPFIFKGGAYETAGDHRLAMGFAVASAAFGVDSRLDYPLATSVSYPGFWEDLRRLSS
jgi:3-phosphoshikimate 1-carboxyvinyltransferase